MGGTLNNVYNNVGYALNLHYEAMARLQEQIATGSRVNRPSDDPFAAYRVLGLSSQERLLGNHIDKLLDVIDVLETSYTVVQGDSGIIASLTKTKVTITQLLSGTYTDEGRRIAAQEINEILEQVVMLANTKHRGQYIFGGSDTDSAAYVVERTDGKITSVTYQGGSMARNIEVADGVEVAAFQVGNNIFSSDDRSEPVFIGDTGAAAGSGTSSVRGYVWLTITQDTDPTKYRPSINDGDDYVTVLKGKGSEVQTLDFQNKTPTGGSFTLTFDGQTTSAIDSTADADTIKAALVALPNLDADDIVSVTGTFATDFTVTFADTMGNVPELEVPAHTLVDGGGAITITPATTTQGIGDTNLAVTDSITGRVLYVDTTAISESGVELVSVAGTHNIFNTLITIRDIFENERGLSNALLSQLRANLLEALDEISALLIRAEVSIGSKIGFMENLRQNLEDIKFNTEQEKTRLEEADIAQVVIDLSRREVLYQMSLAVAGKIMSMSLLDFIR